MRYARPPHQAVPYNSKPRPGIPHPDPDDEILADRLAAASLGQTDRIQAASAYLGFGPLRQNVEVLSHLPGGEALNVG